MAIIRLSRGGHSFEDGGCLVEVASLLLERKIVTNGQVTPEWKWPGKSDQPKCLSPSVTCAARRVNDALPDAELWRLAPLLPRLLRAKRCEDDIERRIRRRISIWAARSVLHHVDDRLREQCEQSLKAAEARLWNDGAAQNPLAWSPGWNTAALASSLAEEPIFGYEVIASAVAALDEDELVFWLSDLLDAHEKALVEEGVMFEWDELYPNDDEVEAVVDAIVASR